MVETGLFESCHSHNSHDLNSPYGAARFAMICHALRVQVHGSPWPRKPLARQWLDA